MFGAPSTPKATRLPGWPRYMTTPTSTSILNHPSDPSHLTSSTSQPAHLSPSLSDSPYTGRSSDRRPFEQRYPPPHSIQQQLDSSRPPSSPRESPMPYPTTPSPQPYGISGSLIVSEPHILQAPLDPSCTPILSSHNDVFMTTSLPKSRPALRPSLSHNGNGVFNSHQPSTWPRRMMPPTESNERTRSSPADNTMSPPNNPPSLLATTAPNGSTYSAPPPPRHDHHFSVSSGQSGLSASRIQVHADQAQAPSASASSTTPQGFGSSLPSLPASSHPPLQSSFAAPPPPPLHYATQHPSSYSDEGIYPASHYEPISAYSPWPAHSSLPSHSDIHQARQHPGYPYPPQSYWSHTLTKMDEPILAPGELPSPRPPMSYAALIGEALLMAPPPHQLYVSEISDSIKRRYTYYRQNPSKVYNGVRHQTSMCKAFVKLPRPYGDQSGGARKWAIRAGSEAWFHSGGYHPPSSTSPSLSHTTVKKSSSVGPSGGKAKSTARAKQLAIGTTSPEDPARRRLPHEPYSPSSGQGGPSIGAAFDGTGRPTWNQAPAQQQSQPGPPAQPMYTLPYPSQGHPTSHSGMHQYPQGYHYVPIQHHQPMHPQHAQHPQHSHLHQGQPMYVPVYGNNPHQHGQHPGHGYMPTPISQAGGQHQQGPGSNGSEDWRYETEVKGEPQQEDQYQHSSPDSMTSHHSHHVASPSL